MYGIEKGVNKMKTVLSIAGSDSSGGAGIQADIKTIAMQGVYAMTAITALTAQNTMGVEAVMEVTPDFLKYQIDTVFKDIPPNAVKVGMVSSPELVEVIAERLKRYHATHIVVDPVMVATSGSVLAKNSAITVMQEKLFPLATVITPNIKEAEVLAGMKITNESEMRKAAQMIGDKFNCAVLCKGGHMIHDNLNKEGMSGANDLLYRKGEAIWFYGKHIDNPNTHGTGCTLSSAIAANLAKGYTLDEAIKSAKNYLSGALASMLDLGKGSGPLDHTYSLKR